MEEDIFRLIKISEDALYEFIYEMFVQHQDKDLGVKTLIDL